MLDISFIKEIINNYIDELGVDRNNLLNNGAIYYMNGNDGTDFDYQCNGRACEFYVFWKKDEVGAIKLLIGDNIRMYHYPEHDPFNRDSIITKVYNDEYDYDLHELCEYLQGTFDDKSLWDEEITNFILYDRSEIEFEEDEDEDIWGEDEDYDDEEYEEDED